MARDMRYARNQQGTELFTSDEFLTAKQIQSYFSRRASKLRHSHSDDQNLNKTKTLYGSWRRTRARDWDTQLFLTISIYVTCTVQVNRGSWVKPCFVRFVNILILTWETSKDAGKLPTCPNLESSSSHAIITTILAYDWPPLLLWLIDPEVPFICKFDDWF